MTTDEAFKEAEKQILRASEIWRNRIKSKYPEAKRCYEEAVRLRDEFFSDNKKVLTEEVNPF